MEADLRTQNYLILSTPGHKLSIRAASTDSPYPYVGLIDGKECVSGRSSHEVLSALIRRIGVTLH